VLQLFNVQSKATLKADRKCLRKRLEAGQVGIAAHKDIVMHGADTKYGEVSESLDENIVIIVVVNRSASGEVFFVIFESYFFQRYFLASYRRSDIVSAGPIKICVAS
jgi:hypothetical protein